MKISFSTILIFIFTLIFVQSLSAQALITVNKSEPYYTGDIIGFNKTCHDYTRGPSTWDFGDGTTKTLPGSDDYGWQYHTYLESGTYTVRYTYGPIGMATPVCPSVTLTYTVKIKAKRAISVSPSNPKVDQLVYIQALNFDRSSVYWDFGDGTFFTGGLTQTHRYQTTGVFSITAREKDVKHETVYTTVSVSPDDRYIQISAPEVRIGEPATASVFNFNSDAVLWNFGDGTVLLGGHTISHIYNEPGVYRITAIDEGGESTKTFETSVKIFGISDEVLLEIAELRFDNGKYYMVVPRNSRILKPVLKLKMRGTGAITGHWLYDNAVYGLVSELSRQGEVKEITMDRSLPLPTNEPGVHTVSFRLTRPEANIEFPVLRYYVLPYEKTLETSAPPDGFVAKEDEIPVFSWATPIGGAARYQITFSNSLFDILNNKSNLIWNDVKGDLNFTPGKEIWGSIKRNKWTFWRVRGLDSFNKVIGESAVNEIKIVIAKAEITLNEVTGLNGSKISLRKDGIISGQEMLLIKGYVEYKDNSDYIILQVLVNDNMVDQLLFRDVKKGEKRSFETSVPGREKGKILFRVLKTSSPSVIVGLKGILLR